MGSIIECGEERKRGTRDGWKVSRWEMMEDKAARTSAGEKESERG